MTARRASLLLIGAAAVAAALLLMLRPGPAAPVGSGVQITLATPAAASSLTPAAPSPQTPAAPARVSPPPGTTRPPAAPAATVAAGGPPAPFVQTFAGQPGVRPLPARPSPTAPVPVPAHVDGCDRAYGTPGQCVPWTFPPNVTDKCAWLATNGFTGLTVRSPDRHRLDSDRNGIACDS
ncbi:hypothetical protein [Paractinoplanes hotanensis]|uniref:Excalibur calcium-binding domain-containing protein n=1 Tax=Paractinoplanes hotanensis TaxID=2906497 RepID=A0ABT0XYJ5_9ACTN|nr:hypothetical protein [Actinoplanes hotanensis]MCM4078862.1 hypothetical protein [Actinoplanes hotanensis]